MLFFKNTAARGCAKIPFNVIIDLDTFKVQKITFKLSERGVGPHSIRKYNNTIITANSYNNTISIFSTDTFEEIRRIDMNKPNVIIIMTDDQGYGDLSCMGAEDFVTATMNSCNPVFVELGLRLGIDTFYKYLDFSFPTVHK